MLTTKLKPKNMPIAVFNGILFLVIAAAIVGTGLIATRQGQLFNGQNLTKAEIITEFPGLSAQDIQDFITASDAYEVASAQAAEWQTDHTFNRLESQDLTAHGKARSWDVVFSSPSAKKSLHVVVDKSGVVRQYEGMGKDSSGHSQNFVSIAADSPKIIEIIQKNPEAAAYINANLGLVNPTYLFLEREEVTVRQVLNQHPETELFWRVILRAGNSQTPSQEIWVDGETGKILPLNEPTTQANN
jgi:hypothetical protein